MSETGEMIRMVKQDPLPLQPVQITANREERAALARRFDLPAIHSLAAELSLEKDEHAVRVDGALKASFTQLCAVSGEPFENAVEEEIDLRFVPARKRTSSAADEEVELEAGDLDEIEYDGDAFDLGEAVAQSFALALDPYAEGPLADRAREEAGLSDPAASGPFAALAALRKE